jgi:hypothetical protein
LLTLGVVEPIEAGSLDGNTTQKVWSDLDASLAQVKNTLEAVHIDSQTDPVPSLAHLEQWLPSVKGKILPGVLVWPYE